MNTTSYDHAVRQELLEASVAHILQQGCASFDVKRSLCMYQSQDGYGCAAAPFILDYTPEMEGIPWDHVADKYPNRILPAADAHREFVDSVLQPAHDEAATQQVRCGAAFLITYKNRLIRYLNEWAAISTHGDRAPYTLPEALNAIP